MKQVAIGVMIVVLMGGTALAGEYKSTADQQKNIAVTIYNSNLGLIKDTRAVQLANGIQEVQFMDVASQINPVTVHIKSLSTPDKLTVLEQNYEYDLLNPQKLLDKYVGKSVKLIDKNYYTDKEEVFNAELLSNNNGPIYRINNEIHLNAPGRIILPEIPENLIAKPTLVWLLDNKNPKAQEIEASYLTSGISWKADYIAVVAKDNNQCDVSGWVTIDNRSGAAYKDAKVKLVAGDVNRVHEERFGDRVMMKSALAEAPKQQFNEESFFEYHLYTLQRQATIKDNQTKQIELLNAVNIPIKEHLVYYGADYYFRNRYNGEMQSRQKVGVFLEIENKEQNNLGMPLPAGTIRAYKQDSEGSLQFIGEDRIDHTPKDEKIKIKMGDAFDVVGERKQTDYKILSRNAMQRFDTEQEWEITLRNHKDKAVEVEVVEPIPGDWRIISASQQYNKTDSSTVKFTVKLDKDETKTVTYRVMIRYY
ncbi:MAG: DUF4139 domain-containing protein [Candidatus Omnitrophica bacterium]|nr:DUF4139 domain-containing protein [Candidatus Omnitrophota bacterium]